ncbi:MAG: YdcF family protein [Rhizobiales bacterium]|nr:YdcF family protein [Hyphomicrobiales bacterium]
MTAGEDGSEPRAARPVGFISGLVSRIGRTVLGLCIVLAVAVAVGFAWFLGSVPIAEPPISERADGIVALTGGASRVSDAVELLAAGHGKRLLITGVHPSASPREIARHVPEFERIFNCCVDLDRSAINTLGNATEARRWARSRSFRSLIVVTSAYHMPRAMAELGHQLPEVRLIPFPVVTEKMRGGQWWSNPATARLLISEYAKYVLALVRMRVGQDARALAASRISATVPHFAPAASAAHR